jgi:predicted PurR-regulated permease PerM
MDQTWSRPARFFILSVMIILISLFLFYIRELIRPLIVAALVAYLLHPLAAALDRGTHLDYRFSVLLVYVAFLAVLVLIPAVLTPIVIVQVASTDIEIQNVINGINQFISKATIFGYQIFREIPGNLEESISQLLHPGQLFTSIQIITENVVWVFLVMILIYYFMADWEKLRMWVFDFIPGSFHVDGIRLYRQLRVIWKTYLRGQLLTVFLIGLISGIAAAIVGLPGAIIIGVVATILAIIPSVGSSFMVFVTAVVAFFSDSATFKFSGFWFVVTVAIVYIGIHLFDNYYLRPRVLGHGLSLHPAVVLFAVISALTLDGALLVLIIVPIISSVLVILRYLISRLTGADPWEKETIEGFPEEKETV